MFEENIKLQNWDQVAIGYRELETLTEFFSKFDLSEFIYRNENQKTTHDEISRGKKLSVWTSTDVIRPTVVAI